MQAVAHEEGEQLAAEFAGMPFYETSAKSGLNIDEMFTRIVTDVKNKLNLDNSAGGGLGKDHGHKLSGAPKGGTTNSKKGSACC